MRRDGGSVDRGGPQDPEAEDAAGTDTAAKAGFGKSKSMTVGTAKDSNDIALPHHVPAQRVRAMRCVSKSGIGSWIANRSK